MNGRYRMSDLERCVIAAMILLLLGSIVYNALTIMGVI